MTSKSITLNVWKENSEVVSTVQGEVNSRFLEVTLLDNNGAIDLTGKSVKFQAKKPDGQVIFNDMSITDASNGIVELELTSQISAVPGILKNCEILIIDESGYTLIVKGIDIYVAPSLGESVIESVSEFTGYQLMMNKVNNMEVHLSDKNNPHSVTPNQINAIAASEKNVAGGVAALNSEGKLSTSVETDPTVPSWAKEATKPSYSFAEIESKPTTLLGYGITDAAELSDVGDVVNLTTDSKTLVGAINEIKVELGDIDTVLDNIIGGE